MFNKTLLAVLLITVAFLTLLSCEKEEDPAPPEAFTNKISFSCTVDSVSYREAFITISFAETGDLKIRQHGLIWDSLASFENGYKTELGAQLKTRETSLSGLVPNTQLYVKVWVKIDEEVTLYSDVKAFKTKEGEVPIVSTAEITANLGISAVSGGSVTKERGYPITQRGVCWKKGDFYYDNHQTIEDSDTLTVDGDGLGSFVSKLSPLEPGTTYTLRAYAINKAGVGYGDPVIFRTHGNPIITASVSEITANSALTGGTIIDYESLEVIERGVCWSLSPLPTVENNKTSDGTGRGSFSSSITGLLQGTIYYVRAYASNATQTFYGNEISFTTLDLPLVTTAAVTNINGSSAGSGGNITNDGGAAITARGVCWSTTPNPTVSTDKTSDGAEKGEFSSAITGLQPNTTYYLRAYATNTVGTAYGEEINFTTTDGLPVLSTDEVTGINGSSAKSGGNVTVDGGFAISERGICWSDVPNPTKEGNHVESGMGTGTYTGSITGLAPNTTYYVRAYATNDAGTGYGDERSFTTTDGLPILSTSTITIATATSTKSGGNITSDGGFVIANRGVCWSTENEPDINHTCISSGTGTGEFVSIINGLTPYTTYYARAFATNYVGTGYGNAVEFKTAGEVTDIDGNIYPTVVIGSQEWMASNLKTTRYNSGLKIPIIEKSEEWESTTSGAWCYYNNDSLYDANYGKLYNWYAIEKASLEVCPSGWVVPSAKEWYELREFLGGAEVAGGKLKEEGLMHWHAPNTGASNESFFDGRPGGYRTSSGSSFMGTYGRWWIRPYYRDFYTIATVNWYSLSFNSDDLRYETNRLGYTKIGYSVRCIKDD